MFIYKMNLVIYNEIEVEKYESRDVIASGLFEKIGSSDSFYTIKYNGEKNTKEAFLADHSVAVSKLMDELVEN